MGLGLSLTVVAAVAFLDAVVLVVIVTFVDEVLAVFAVAVVIGFRRDISVSAATVRGTPSLLRAGHYSLLALAKLESLNSPDGLDRNCFVVAAVAVKDGVFFVAVVAFVSALLAEIAVAVVDGFLWRISISHAIVRCIPRL